MKGGPAAASAHSGCQAAGRRRDDAAPFAVSVPTRPANTPPPPPPPRRPVTQCVAWQARGRLPLPLSQLAGAERGRRGVPRRTASHAAPLSRSDHCGRITDIACGGVWTAANLATAIYERPFPPPPAPSSPPADTIDTHIRSRALRAGSTAEGPPPQPPPPPPPLPPPPIAQFLHVSAHPAVSGALLSPAAHPYLISRAGQDKDI
ncbi:uncharacterized protein LOC126176375 [Schistocerca cancellata]|uniref:uncharacterized protein LOC126176375 n=1 Tax=Schistocerca cancellata TaxID=274614 RepID=UPI002118A949|nr:uncharacterized protein LOC126176375 [Schistocerca cancellata]